MIRRSGLARLTERGGCRPHRGAEHRHVDPGGQARCREPSGRRDVRRRHRRARRRDETGHLLCPTRSRPPCSPPGRLRIPRDRVASIWWSSSRRWGLPIRSRGKVKQPASGVQIAELLTSGEADLGFQQVSELLHAPGVEFLGPLPTERSRTSRCFPPACTRRHRSPSPPGRSCNSSPRPAAGPILKKTGLEPASQGAAIIH